MKKHKVNNSTPRKGRDTRSRAPRARPPALAGHGGRLRAGPSPRGHTAGRACPPDRRPLFRVPAHRCASHVAEVAQAAPMPHRWQRAAPGSLNARVAGNLALEEAMRAVSAEFSHASEEPGTPRRGGSGGADFGPNEGLVEELYQRYQADPDSVDQAWWNFFADYRPEQPVATAAAGS